MADIVIRNGTIVDGTGAPAYVGDVAIRDGLILDVGVNLVVKGTLEIDASGKHVTPGWVDPHTHYDAHAMWDPTLNPSTGSGVTTVVCGNCAVGLAPCPKPLRTFATDLLEAIEDIPAASINSLEGFYQWETFPEYMAHMETKSFACDIGVLVGHASIRSWVMGTQANASDVPGGAESAPLTDDDIAKMRKVTEEAVAAGALGLSSSRVSSHRDATGVLLPGSLASRGELLAMGNGIADGGGGVFELASSWDLYDDFVREGRPDRELVREYERKDRDLLHAMATIPGVTVTTGGGSGQPVGGGTSMTPETAWSHTGVLEMIDAITASGGDMWTTPMMRLGNVFIGIKGEAMNPLLASKRFREFVNMDVTSTRLALTDAMLQQLQNDDALRAAIVEELSEVKNGAFGVHFVGHEPFRQWIWPWSTDLENTKEDSLLFAPELEDKTMWEYVYDIMTHPEEPHGGVLQRALFNYGQHSLDPMADMFQHDKVVAGFSDAGAHGRGQCEAATPTSLIAFWCRDRSRGDLLPIELIVKKQTRDSALMMGLTDRGELLPGKKADVNVFDLAALNVLPPEYVNDMPLNAGRWVQASTGYQMTICSGVVTFEHGQHTGALPGNKLTASLVFQVSPTVGK
jgi:N-acyl-D-aspartate/D-glutamate deacylase